MLKYRVHIDFERYAIAPPSSVVCLSVRQSSVTLVHPT